MGGVHDKVIRAVSQQLKADDELLYERVTELRGVTAEQLGVHKDFCCPLPSAVSFSFTSHFLVVVLICLLTFLFK